MKFAVVVFLLLLMNGRAGWRLLVSVVNRFVIRVFPLSSLVMRCGLGSFGVGVGSCYLLSNARCLCSEF